MLVAVQAVAFVAECSAPVLAMNCTRSLIFEVKFRKNSRDTNSTEVGESTDYLILALEFGVKKMCVKITGRWHREGQQTIHEGIDRCQFATRRISLLVENSCQRTRQRSTDTVRKRMHGYFST